MVASTTSRRLPRSRLGAQRAPVLVELSLQSCVAKAGYVGQASAHQIVPLPQLTKSAASTTAEDYYYLYSPVLQHLLHYLTQDPPVSERRAIVVFDSGLALHAPLQEALVRILLNALQCQAVTFVSSMLLVGKSLMLPTSGVDSTSLAVYLTEQEAQCIVSSNGQALPYTYQSTGVRANYQPAKTVYEMKAHWNAREGKNQVVVAILKCLESCPIDLRKRAIHNLFFCGSAANDASSICIAKLLQETLREKVLTENSPTSEEAANTSSAPEKGYTDDYSEIVTAVPVAILKLSPLADSVSVVALPDAIRPDLAAWIGASLWANHVHNQDAESPLFKWITEY